MLLPIQGPTQPITIIQSHTKLVAEAYCKSKTFIFLVLLFAAFTDQAIINFVTVFFRGFSFRNYIKIRLYFDHNS